MLILALLESVFPKGKTEYLKALADNTWILIDRDIETKYRLWHFLAQVGHETGGVSYSNETPDRKDQYDGRKDIGNVKKGDGYLYRGRGCLQLTGRGNYRWIGKALKKDYEGHPELVSSPIDFWLSGAEFWSQMKLNRLADADDIYTITKRINGGLNGYKDRVRWLERLKVHLS